MSTANAASNNNKQATTSNQPKRNRTTHTVATDAAASSAAAFHQTTSSTPPSPHSSHSASPTTSPSPSPASRARTTTTSMSAAGGAGANADRVEWSRATILDFIEDYRCQRVLWDPNTKGYHIKQTKYEALKLLSQKYGTEIRSIRSKIKSLRSSFHREHGKVLTGRSRGVHYQPMWFAYEAIRFILDGERDCKIEDGSNGGSSGGGVGIVGVVGGVVDVVGNGADECSGDELKATAASMAAALGQPEEKLALMHSLDLEHLMLGKAAALHQQQQQQQKQQQVIATNAMGDSVETQQQHQQQQHEEIAARVAAAVAAVAAAAAAAAAASQQQNFDEQAQQQHQLQQQQQQQEHQIQSQQRQHEHHNNHHHHQRHHQHQHQHHALSSALTTSAMSLSTSTSTSTATTATATATTETPLPTSGGCAGDADISNAAAAVAAAAAAVTRSDFSDSENYCNISAEDVKTEIIEADLPELNILEGRPSTPSPINYYKPTDLTFNRKRRGSPLLEEGVLSPSKQAQQQQLNLSLNHSQLTLQPHHVVLQQLQLSHQHHQHQQHQQQLQKHSNDAHKRDLSPALVHLSTANLAATTSNAASMTATDVGGSVGVGLISVTGMQTLTASTNNINHNNHNNNNNNNSNGGGGSSSSSSNSNSHNNYNNNNGHNNGKLTANHVDEYGVFGEYVAITIRKLKTSKAKIVVKHLINNLLYEAELGKYDHGIPASKEPPQLYKMTQ